MTPATRLSPDARIQVEAAVRRTTRREACGFLLGHRIDDGAAALVEHLVLVRNAAEEPRTFEVSPADRERVFRLARAAGQEVLALFHTHLSRSVEPSAMDRQGLLRSDLPWCIASRAPVAGPPTAPTNTPTMHAHAADAIQIAFHHPPP